jgi:putative aldouronate transport system permease protein
VIHHEKTPQQNERNRRGNLLMIKTKSDGFIYKLKKNRTLLIMLLPAIIFFLLFAYIPMAGVIIAFKSYNYTGGILGSPWSGLNNFKFLFKSGDALNIAKNTLLYNTAFMLVGNFLQIASAIILAQITAKRFKKITQSFMFLPYIMSWVVVGAIAYNVLGYNNGTLNGMLKAIGKSPLDIYNSPNVWPFIIVAIDAWKNIGYGCILYLAAIMSIDQEMYEAAEIDGANLFQRMFKITLPLLTPTVIILVLLSVGNIFRGNFQEFYQLTGNNVLLLGKTDVIDTFVTRSLLQMNDFGMSTAAGLLQSTLGFITIMLVNFGVKKYDKDYALF